MKKSLLIILLSLFPALANAQTADERAIRSTIDRLFEAMRANDSTLLKTTLAAECTLRSIVKNKQGETKLMQEPIGNFIKAIGTKRPNTLLDERLLSYDIKIDGDMGLAWTPYRFYINDTFSHCGVNTFTLMRQPDGWKIISIVDTRRKDCDPKP